MVSTITPLNSIQKIPEVGVVSRTSIQPATYYVTPPGRKAKIRIVAQMTGLGAATQANVVILNTQLLKWVAADVDVIRQAEVVLEAGDTVRTTQNVGTNAEFNVNLVVQETDAA